MAEFKIAVIGAGPAGCMLARLLSMAGISVTVFEAEKGLDIRSQGGSLDLHTDSGLKAMKQADLYAEFLKHARFDGEALTMADKKLVKYVTLGGGTEGQSRGRPEIDRPKLREILAESVPRDCIVWGKRLKSVGPDLTLNFEDGTETGFDLIVGADGAFSKVRPFLSSTSLVYTGIGGYQGTIQDAESTQPELYKLVNRGSLFSLSDRKFIAGQQMGDGSLNTSAWFLAEERHSEKYDAKGAQAVKTSFKEDCRGWNPQLLDFICQSSDDSIVYRPLYMLPVGHSWEHKPGVTIIGDAAHLMTPFAGEGVNLALTDAMALAEAIVKARETCKKKREAEPRDVLSQSIRAFEADLFKRATKVQQLTYRATEISFYTEAPPWIVIRARVLSALKNMSPPVLYPLLVVLCYLYFYVRRFVY